MAHIYAVGHGSVDIFMHMEENFTLVMDINAMHSCSILIRTLGHEYINTYVG